MPLGKVQSLIVAKLIAMGRLTPEQRDAIAARPQDLNGDALDRLLQEDPAWHDLIPFHEYFHGDTGAGLGASHQTGWTGLIAKLLRPRK